MRWFLYILFPPYGLYVMWFKKKVKWFIKAPITVLFFLIMILAVDQQLNPYRVEEQLSSEAIEKRLKEEQVWQVERLGAFLYKEDTFVLYETYVDNGLYHAIMKDNGEKQMIVDGIYQVWPKEKWIDQGDYTISMPPIVALALFESDKVSNNWSWKEKDSIIEFNSKNLSYKIKEEKTVEFLNDDKEVYDSVTIAHALPNKVQDYFDQHVDELGEIEDIVEHSIHEGMDSFYIQTTNHLYRVDRYANGDINLLIGENT